MNLEAAADSLSKDTVKQEQNLLHWSAPWAKWLKMKTINWANNVFGRLRLPGPACRLSSSVLLWSREAAGKVQPPERGRLRQTLPMKSLPALGLNIASTEHRGGGCLHSRLQAADTIGSVFVGWRQGHCAAVGTVRSLSLWPKWSWIGPLSWAVSSQLHAGISEFLFSASLTWTWQTAGATASLLGSASRLGQFAALWWCQ